VTLRRLGHRRLAKGVFLRLDRAYVLDTHGEAKARDIVRHPGGVGILPVDGDRVFLVRQYRAALGADFVEIPAGKLDPGDQDPLTAAQRELKEELGATAETWKLLAAMHPSPGYTNEILHLYAAIGLNPGDRRPDGLEEDHLTIVGYDLEEALDSIEKGEITDAKTQIALLTWARKRSLQ
jgi:ADP-ribose pyrophosphatase